MRSRASPRGRSRPGPPSPPRSRLGLPRGFGAAAPGWAIPKSRADSASRSHTAISTGFRPGSSVIEGNRYLGLLGPNARRSVTNGEHRSRSCGDATEYFRTPALRGAWPRQRRPWTRVNRPRSSTTWSSGSTASVALSCFSKRTRSRTCARSSRSCAGWPSSIAGPTGVRPGWGVVLARARSAPATPRRGPLLVSALARAARLVPRRGRRRGPRRPSAGPRAVRSGVRGVAPSAPHGGTGGALEGGEESRRARRRPRPGKP